MEREKELAATHHTITRQDAVITELRDFAETRSREIDSLQERIKEKESDLSREKIKETSAEREKAALEEKLREKETENQQLKSAAREAIAEKDRQLEAANEKLAARDKELAQAQERIKELEERQRTASVEREQEQTWGNDSWGTNQGWGTAGTTKSYEEEKLW